MVAPVPEVTTLPGLHVIDHVPEAGKPLKLTLAVAKEQLGWVIVPTTGAVGDAGCEPITTLADVADVQVAALVTV